jgi:flagellar basal body-associated protein FliL
LSVVGTGIDRRRRGVFVGILWIILIIVIVLALLGFLGRGAW